MRNIQVGRVLQNLGELQQGAGTNQVQGEGFSDLLMFLMGQVGSTSLTKTEMGLVEEQLSNLITGDNQDSMQEAGLLPFTTTVQYAQKINDPTLAEEILKGTSSESSSIISPVENSANQTRSYIGTLTEELPLTPVQLMPQAEMGTEETAFLPTGAQNDPLSSTKTQSIAATQNIMAGFLQEGFGELPIENLPYQQSAIQQADFNLTNNQRQVLQQAILYQPNLAKVRDQLKLDNNSLEQPSDFSKALQSDELELQKHGLSGAINGQSTREGSGVTGIVTISDAKQISGKSTEASQTLQSVDQQLEGKLTNATVEGQLSVSKSSLEQQGNKDGMQQENAFQNRQEALVQHSAKSVEQPIQPLPKELPVTQLPSKVTEMIRAMMVQQNSGQTSLKMKLQPEELGEVTVKLTWSKGELSAHFVTSSGMARDALESSFPQLKELLAQQNIRLSEAEVFMGQQSGQWDQGSFNEGQQWQRTKQHAKGKVQFAGIASVTEPISADPSEHSTNSGLNLVV